MWEWEYATSFGYGAGGGPVLGSVGSPMRGWAGGISAIAMVFFLCWRRKIAPNMTKAMRAMPPRTPPTMAPTGVDGAVVASGGLEDVAAPARLASVVDEVTGGTVLEVVITDDDLDVDRVDDLEVEDEVEEERREVDEDEDVFFVVRELVFFLVEVLVGLTSVMLLLLSPLAAVWALITDPLLMPQ